MIDGMEQSYTKGSKTPSRDYQGERSAKALIDYASNLIPADRVKKLKTIEEIGHWQAAVSSRSQY